MNHSLIDRRIAERRRKRERVRRVSLWLMFMFLVVLHIGLYVYFDEVIEFVRAGWDAVIDQPNQAMIE
jgi:DMSO/TMAO reductase YedYZ heme-binding membrane subunit